MLKSGRACIFSKPLILIQSTRRFFNETSVKKFEEIPGPFQFPFIGSSWKYFPIIGEFDTNHIDEAAQSLYKKYGSIVKQKAKSFNIVHLFDPKDFEKVSKMCQRTNQHKRVSFSALKSYRDSKPRQYKTAGLLAGNGPTWWDIRKVAQKPISSLKQTRYFLAQDDEIIKDYVNLLGRKGKVDDYLLLGNQLNTELTLKYLFDERLDNFDDASPAKIALRDKLIKSVLVFTEKVAYFDQANLLWTFPSKELHETMKDHFIFIEKYVLEQVEKLKSRNLPDDNCITAQLFKDPDFDEKDLGTLIDLVYGGIDTTAITSTFLLWEVAKDKEVQKKLRDEALKLLPRGNESEISVETLQQASYFKAAIKENFRLNPIITAQNRQLPESIELSGYEVPKDTMAIMEIFVSCRVEKHFKNPLKFQPERWIKSSEGYESSHPYSMLHFGLGVRACIARRRAEQLLLTILLRILSEYEIHHNDEQMTYSTEFLLKPSKPIELTFKKLTK